MEPRRDAWNAGRPTDDFPLLVTVIDECQTYLDIAQHKGDRAMESLARSCIALVGELAVAALGDAIREYPGYTRHRCARRQEPALRVAAEFDGPVGAWLQIPVSRV